MTRNGNQDIANSAQAGTEICASDKVRGERGIGKVVGVDTIVIHRNELRLIAPPDANFPVAARELQRQRRSPGTCANNSDGLCGIFFY